jgi:outer membrane protein assembly factor BamB
MATDGLRVHAVFANGDLAAFALDGRPAWSKNLGVPDNPYGHATSLATFEGNLIVQWDQGAEEDNKSKLIAIEGATGKVAWQRPACRRLWASPGGQSRRQTADRQPRAT